MLPRSVARQAVRARLHIMLSQAHKLSRARQAVGADGGHAAERAHGAAAGLAQRAGALLRQRSALLLRPAEGTPGIFAARMPCMRLQPPEAVAASHARLALQMAFKRMGLPAHLAPDVRDGGLGFALTAFLKRLQHQAKQACAFASWGNGVTHTVLLAGCPLCQGVLACPAGGGRHDRSNGCQPGGQRAWGAWQLPPVVQRLWRRWLVRPRCCS